MQNKPGAELANHQAIPQTNQDTFQHDVLATQQPVLVDFWASWCMPCKTMSGVVEEVATAYSKQLKVFGVNADTNQEILDKYQVTALPTFMVFKNGKMVASAAGVMSRGELEQLFTKFIQ